MTEVNSMMLSFKDGTETNFEDIYYALHDRLYYYAKKRLSEHCDDIVQETFIRILSDRKVFDNVGHLTGAAFMIARNLCTDLLRKIQHHQRSEGVVIEMETLAHEQALFYAQFRSDVMAEVEQILASNNGIDVKIFRLYMMGYGAAEIAQALDMGEKTVHNRLSNAKGKLKAELQQQQWRLVCLAMLMAELGHQVQTVCSVEG